MKDTNRRKLSKRQRRLRRRGKRRQGNNPTPVLSGPTPIYDVSDRVTATKAGGLAAVHGMVRRLRLAERINASLDLFRRHQPYHESDHVLAIAYSHLAGGQALQDLELLRQDEALLDMLGAECLPDPTTSGDFLRRFGASDVDCLQGVLNEIRPELWRLQGRDFRRQAIIDADGTVADTSGEKKRGMEFNYHKKLWGYHPLLVSLANTREPLFLINRPGNVPSHKDCAPVLDQAIDLVQPHFDSVLLRGDTDFSLTGNFDRWTNRDVRFVFGFDMIQKVKDLACDLPPEQWQTLKRRPRYSVATQPRKKRDNIKEGIVERKKWKNHVLRSEAIAEIPYQPGKCQRTYRMVLLRKRIEEKKGQEVLFENFRYFAYISNDPSLSAEEIVWHANDRCDQENLIAQLKSGLGAMRVPAYDLVSNWAYMVIVSLAWSLKAWFALLLPRRKDRLAILKMEFRTFLQWVVLIPAQVVRHARQAVVRLLAYTDYTRLLLSGLNAAKRSRFQRT